MSVFAFQGRDFSLSPELSFKRKKGFFFLSEINRVFKLSASWKVGVTFLPPVVTQLFCGGYCPAHLYCMANIEIKLKNATLKTKMRSCSWQLPADPEPQAAPMSVPFHLTQERAVATHYSFFPCGSSQHARRVSFKVVELVEV